MGHLLQPGQGHQDPTGLQWAAVVPARDRSLCVGSCSPQAKPQAPSQFPWMQLGRPWSSTGGLGSRAVPWLPRWGPDGAMEGGKS